MINEWICKNFKADKHGNVTIANLIISEFMFKIWICLIVGFVIENILYIIYTTEENLDTMMIITHMTIVYGIISYIIYRVAIILGKINIAKCERK